MAEIPTHLADWADLEETDGYIFRARLRCPCGDGRVRLWHPGGIWYNPRMPLAHPTDITVDGRRFFLVRAECVGCERDRLVIDVDIHGCSGIVERNPDQAAAPRPPLRPWSCIRCGGEEHTAAVEYTLLGQEDFDDSVRTRFPEVRREDAFIWLGIDTTCVRCGLFTRLWTECELL